jgi:hypothetical protein
VITNLKHTEANAAVRFIARLDPVRERWALGALRGGAWWWETFHGPARDRMAESWITARFAEGSEVQLLLPDASSPVRGREIPAQALIGARFTAAVAVSAERFLTAPDAPATVYRDQLGRVIAVWRLPEVSPIAMARYQAALRLASCPGAAPLEFYVPLPRSMKPVELGGSIYRAPMLRLAQHAPALAAPDAAPLLPAPANQHTARGGVEDEFLARRLEEALATRGVEGGRVVGVRSGPIVTVCEYEPARTVRTEQIVALADDVAMLLKVKSVIARPVTEHGLVCFDISNISREIVQLRDLFGHAGWIDARDHMALPICLGVSVAGEPRFFDLATAPHLLVAGTTGSGKSVALNGMLLSLMAARGPEQLRLVLIDPKRVELAPYAGVAHLLTPIESAPEHASTALQWLVAEMDRRYDAFAAEGVQDITQFNPSAADALPRIVLVIDEYASLIARAKDAKPALDRIFAEGRAAGIHAVLATQHPSAKTIDSSIKTNIPTRLIFAMGQKEGSQAALGDSVATKLLGKGDGLFLSNGALDRILSPFVSGSEIQQAVSEIRKLGAPEYAIEPRKQAESPEIGDLSAEKGSGKAEPRDVIKGIIIKTLLSGDKTTPVLHEAVKSGGFRSKETFEKARGELEKANVITSRKDDSGGRALIWSLVK